MIIQFKQEQVSILNVIDNRLIFILHKFQSDNLIVAFFIDKTDICIDYSFRKGGRFAYLE